MKKKDINYYITVRGGVGLKRLMGLSDKTISEGGISHDYAPDARTYLIVKLDRIGTKEDEERRNSILDRTYRWFRRRGKED